MVDDFDKSLELVKVQSKALKNSSRPYALYYLTKLFSYIPMVIYLFITYPTSRKTTFTFTNVAGPMTPLVYEGIECNKMVFLPPGMHLMSCGISIISISETAKIGAMMDSALCNKPEEILKFFEQTRCEILAASRAQL